MIRIAVTVILLSIIIAAHVRAQPGGWVDQLRSTSGLVCCYDNDGRRLDDPEWRTSGESYEVLFKEGWVKVDPSSVVTMTNKDGIARVWSEMQGSRRAIRCFLPGALG